MKMAGAHPRPQFSVDERVFMVLNYTETENVLEIITRFQRQFPNQRTPCRQTMMDNYNKYVQYGLSLNRIVGDSGRPRIARIQANMVRRALEAHLLTKTQFLTINTPVHLLKTVVWDVHQPSSWSSYSSSAFCFIRLFQFLLSLLYRKALEELKNTWLCNTCDHPFV